jgi:tetratricopeptide (TPR) repeat protein
MGFFESMVNRGSGRSKALALYKRGMAKAKKRDHGGAIEDYSASIDMSDAPPDVTAMALYNRAIAYAAAKDTDRALDDLNAVLAMTELPANIKAAANEKLKRITRRSNESRSPKA